MKILILSCLFFIGHQALAQRVQFDIQQVFTIQDQEKSPLLGQVAAAALDGDGNLYLLDNGNRKIHKYAADGSFIQSFGREGRGPGEFLRGAESLAFNNADSSIYIIDYPNGRVVGYNTETGEHINTFNLQSTSAIPINKLISFNGNLLFLGSHQQENTMIHKLNETGETTHSFGDFIDFGNFRHNSNGRQQLSQVHASMYAQYLLVGLYAPNRLQLYNENLELIREFEDDLLPTPWKTHMTMEPGRYASTFYSMGLVNQILSEERYLFRWEKIVDPEGPVTESFLELRSLKNGELIYGEKIEDLYILDIFRQSENEAILFTRDTKYTYSIQSLTITE